VGEHQRYRNCAPMYHQLCKTSAICSKHTARCMEAWRFEAGSDIVNASTGTRWTAGLTALDELVMLGPHRADDYDEAHPAVPSNSALQNLTKLTRLQLQVSSPWPNTAADEALGVLRVFAATTPFANAITQHACAEALLL
jgi:hypothetical protein